MVRGFRFAVVVAWVFAAVLLLAPPALSAGAWSATGSLATARYLHTATLLPNGKVLVAGGNGSSGSGGVLASAELYDPSAGTWSATGPMSIRRDFHTATLLPIGKVLVAGGLGSSGGVLASAELYDPSTGKWSATGPLAIARYFHTATLLPNGKVLVAGGNGSSGVLANAELYDPSTGTWSATGPMSTRREFHTATLLPNGKVLVAGGFSNLASAELYDPSTGKWSATGPMATARYSQTATLLPNGKVLVAGGVSGSGAGAVLLASAELYDPSTGTWSATGPMAAARWSQTATLLPNGKVLVAGGFGTSGRLASAELYDPSTGTWSATGSLSTALYEHTATLLPNGNVLVAGGNGTSGALASAELYAPVTDSDLTLTVPVDQTVNATSPSGATVTFTATTSDESLVTVSVDCSPPSGSTFAIGDNPVTCTATDTDGDTNSPVQKSFNVHVKGAAEQLSDLAHAVNGVGPGRSLADKVASVQSDLAANDTSDACGTLNAFINEVNAQTGRKISATTAGLLIAAAQQIEAVIPCTS